MSQLKAWMIVGSTTMVLYIVVIGILCFCFGCERKHAETPNKNKTTEVRILAFTASWCGPCKEAKPILIQVQKSNVGVTMQIVDIDEQPEMAKEYGVTSVPRFFVFSKGRLIVSVSDVNVACMVAIGEVRRNR